MKEYPIIFSGEMVRAILDGRKTQTRRLNGLKEINLDPNYWRCERILPDGMAIWNGGHGFDIDKIKCPYGIPGDRLWVRETWAHMLDFGYSTGNYFYRASYTNGGPYDDVQKWKPSIFMPRAASRITLEVTDVRVKLVQDISEDDARAEGTDWDMAHECNDWSPSYNDPDSGGYPAWVPAFEILWDSINAKRGYGWDSNPWVWVVTFKRLGK